MTEQEMDAVVAEAMANATAGGYDVSSWGITELAIDLATYCADLEGVESLSDIERSIKRIRDRAEVDQ